MIDYKKYCYEISYDDCDESPNDWGNQEIFLVYDHRDFYVERKGFDTMDIYNYLQGDENYDFSDYWIFNVYAYIHSGISLSLSHNGDQWDTSLKGFILVKKNLREDLTLEIAKTYAEGCLENWNAYLSGNIYRFTIYKKETCEHCDNENIEEIDSCGGFYDEEDCVEECKLTIDTFKNN